jgi:hypothetical protein
LSLLWLAGTAGPVAAQGSFTPIGQITGVAAGGGTYDYTLTMSDPNSSTSPVGSFWFGWIPGQFYLPSSPSSVQTPVGWTDSIVPGSGAFSIQYVASSSASYIAAGTSLNFGFVSTDTPAVLAGNAPNFPGTPVTTTVAYGAGLFSSPSATIVLNVNVPEPSSFALLLAGSLSLGVAGWRRLRGGRI